MKSGQHPSQDLTVKGEAVERIYSSYKEQRYIVNRRYQRKLVWTLQEKKQFIDSIMNGYPVPIVLLAEIKSGTGGTKFEIIDGMQRLNATFSFIENEYAINNCFFDLNAMAETKALLDSGALQQREPVLSRELSVRIASYTFPLSIYEFSGEGEVDEVFRRINSGGRKLSRQELRIAGATGHFAAAVRTISAKIRGDVSSSDQLPLNEMKKVSITNRDLTYGIDVDEVFWVKHGVLTKEQLRESTDEELVADMLAFTLLDPKPPSRSEALDEFFGYAEEQPSERHKDIELATQKVTAEVVALEFQRVLDQLKLAAARADRPLIHLLMGEQTSGARRYFQVLFLAFHKLMIVQNLEVSDAAKLEKLVDSSGKTISVPEGGRWGADHRAKLVDGAAGMYTAAFAPSKGYDPATVRWVTQLENIFRQSYTEQSAYDFKQGFIRLDGTHSFDNDSFDKILKTLSGIANLRKGVRGYVLVGVADKETDALRIQQLYASNARQFETFWITGVDHEAIALNKSLDALFMELTTRIKSSALSEPLRDYVARNLKCVRYFDKSVFVFEAQAQELPSHYDGKYYVRHGNKLEEVVAADYGALFARYMQGM